MLASYGIEVTGSYKVRNSVVSLCTIAKGLPWYHSDSPSEALLWSNMPEKSEKSPSSASKPPNEDVVSYGERPSDLEEIRMGVWSILKTRKKTTAATFKLRDTLDSWTASVREKSAIVSPFIKDVYVSVGPALFLVYTLSSLATNLEMALYLHLSNNLLQQVCTHDARMIEMLATILRLVYRQIEATLLSGKPDPWAVCRALGLHAFFFVLLSTLIRWNMFVPSHLLILDWL